MKLIPAATPSQWSNVDFVIGVPLIVATASLGTPPPQAPRATASTTAALSAARMRIVRATRPRMVTGYAASRFTASRASAASTTAGKRAPGSSGTRIETCARPDSYSASGIRYLDTMEYTGYNADEPLVAGIGIIGGVRHKVLDGVVLIASLVKALDTSRPVVA